jgi:uncharacterized membrane protein YcaP (DUF421 family)
LFFESWADLGRILIVGALAYAALILLLRISGKRTLSKMNAFDFIITVAMGSTLATILLSRDVTLSEGVVALALLIALQFVITWSAVRRGSIRKLITSDPSLLFYRGEFLRDAMRRERVSEGAVRSAVRDAGSLSLEAVEAVVLETDGSLSVVASSSLPGRPDGVGNTALRDVVGVPSSAVHD